MKEQIKSKLFSLIDNEYKEFTSSLMPTVEKNTVLGVRVPELRKLSKSFSYKDFEGFCYDYHEEKLLHVFVIANIKDFNLCVSELEKFLPEIDNWAICDSLRPMCFKNHKDKLVSYINDWLKSKHTYTVRFGIGMLMCHYLDENFCDGYANKVSLIKSEEYYVNMMIAWYFATALAKQYEKVISYFTENKFDIWVHNKALKKAIESYRIPKETKDYLRTLKRKNER